eukprot:14353423-Alexandrium_andersonii.AAC.1
MLPLHLVAYLGAARPSQNQCAGVHLQACRHRQHVVDTGTPNHPTATALTETELTGAREQRTAFRSKLQRWSSHCGVSVYTPQAPEMHL